MKELEKDELEKINGGVIWLIAAVAFVGGIIVEGLASELIKDGPVKCYEEFIAGWNSVK